MKFLTAAITIFFFMPVTGLAQITIDAPEKSRTEVFSPMVVTAPLANSLRFHPQSRTARLFKTEELSTTVCDAVIIKSVVANVEFNKKRTKGVLSVDVSTFTEPPQDKMAFVKFRVRNDHEVLVIHSPNVPVGNDITFKINAEEKKTRTKTSRANIDPEQLERILAGDNPRVEITLKVEIN